MLEHLLKENVTDVVRDSSNCEINLPPSSFLLLIPHPPSPPITPPLPSP